MPSSDRLWTWGLEQAVGTPTAWWSLEGLYHGWLTADLSTSGVIVMPRGVNAIWVKPSFNTLVHRLEAATEGLLIKATWPR